MRLFLVGILLSAFAISSSIASTEDPDCSGIEECQKIPPRFTWQKSTIDVGTFLRPDGWFLKEEIKGDVRALFITRENIDASGSFATGLTVNKVPNFVQKTKTRPSQYAISMIAKLRTTGAVLRESVVSGNFPDMNVLRIKVTKNDGNVVVHYIAIGDDSKNIFYLISFESSERDWDEQIKIGTPMLNFFAL